MLGTDAFEISINLAKMIIIFLMMVNLVPMLVWVERRGSAFIQNRFGPNRVGPLGLTQLIADAVKFIFKEAFVPEKSNKFLFYAAPVVALIPGALAFGAIPLSIPIDLSQFTVDFSFLGMQVGPHVLGPYRIPFQSYEIGIGIVFVLGVSSLAPYALLMAGWGSANKYSLLGALRACAQTISYELAMGLSLVGILLLYQSFDFSLMIDAQSGPLTFMWGGKEVVFSWLPNWGIFYQPLGFILFFAAAFAETNRLPFDLPEAEAELVAGYHTEYAGLKMNMFYIGEYGHMLVASALLAVFYFGGYHFPVPGWTQEVVQNWVANNGVINGLVGFVGLEMSQNVANVVTAFIFHLSLVLKMLFFLWVFVWVRWTLPRFRYDQLMDLGWKTMLPWALANTILTAVVILAVRYSWS